MHERVLWRKWAIAALGQLAILGGLFFGRSGSWKRSCRNGPESCWNARQVGNKLISRLLLVISVFNYVCMMSELCFCCRFRTLALDEQKRIEAEEDRLLATTLHNMIAFMLAMKLNPKDIKKKARRLLGRSHIGLGFSKEVNDLLDRIHYLVCCFPVSVLIQKLIVFISKCFTSFVSIFLSLITSVVNIFLRWQS